MSGNVFVDLMLDPRKFASDISTFYDDITVSNVGPNDQGKFSGQINRSTDDKSVNMFDSEFLYETAKEAREAMRALIASAMEYIDKEIDRVVETV